MGLVLSLAKGFIDLRTQPEIYLGLDNDREKIFSLTGEDTWSIRKLDSADRIDLAYHYPPFLDDLFDFIQSSNAPMGKEVTNIINNYLGLTSYLMDFLYSKQDELETILDYNEENSETYSDAIREFNNNNGAIEEIEDLRRDCIEYNKHHKVKKMLPMFYFTD